MMINIQNNRPSVLFGSKWVMPKKLRGFIQCLKMQLNVMIFEVILRTQIIWQIFWDETAKRCYSSRLEEPPPHRGRHVITDVSQVSKANFMKTCFLIFCNGQLKRSYQSTSLAAEDLIQDYVLYLSL